MFCWLLSKPVENASADDVIECVDLIKVWFSDFQIYKHLLRKMYKERFDDLAKKRWDFLNSNKNRFKLLAVLIGDYGLLYPVYEVLCFDTEKSEYIFVETNQHLDDLFEIKKIATKETDLQTIYDAIKKSETVERVEMFYGKSLSYTLLHDEYEPLFRLFVFLSSFYHLFVVDGGLTSGFSPVDPKTLIAN